MYTGLLDRTYKIWGKNTTVNKLILPSKVKRSAFQLAILVLNKAIQGRRLLLLYVNRGNCMVIPKYLNNVVTWNGQCNQCNLYSSNLEEQRLRWSDPPLPYKLVDISFVVLSQSGRFPATISRFFTLIFLFYFHFLQFLVLMCWTT